jgi:DNA-binding CsgD family transcriptional regulator
MARVLLVDCQLQFKVALAALLSRGWNSSRIGGHLCISQHTVRTHIQNIFEKLGMHSKLEAAAFALRWPLELDPDGTAERAQLTGNGDG